MYTISLIGRALALFLLAVSTAIAQNFVDNPYFDTDLGSWQSFTDTEAGAQVEWTSDLDHFDALESHAGALRIIAYTHVSSAQQCVSVENDDLYIVTVWARARCSGSAELYLSWANNDCTADGKYFPVSVRSRGTGDWEPLQVIGVVPDDRRKALVTLANPGGCPEDPNAYFDDVTFYFDWIFKDDFEPLFVNANIER